MDEIERLQRHRVRHRLNGMPILDERGDPVGVVAEPLWKWDDLTPAQRAEVEAFADEWPRDDPDPMRWALAEYGIACVHVWRRDHPKLRSCRRCYVVEELPGRVVDVGGAATLVPDPPPPVWRVPVLRSITVMSEADPMECVVDALEYHWDGSRYVLASKGA